MKIVDLIPTGAAVAAVLSVLTWACPSGASAAATPATPAVPTTGAPATPATPAVPATRYKRGTEPVVGPFNASYYHGNDFVASEQVARPSINYSYSDFHGIPSQDFHAVWTGNVEVFSPHEIVDINFDVSWSDVSLFIDGKEISSWSNSNRTIEHEFMPGVHQVKIEYENNWHTTGFDVSFTTNTMYSKDEALPLIAPYIDSDTQIIYVGAYESGDLYNNSTVFLDGTANKVFLFLTSYDSLNWVIENPHNVTITGIAYSSYSTVATVTADATVPTFEIKGLAYGYDDFSAPSDDITYLTGRVPDYTYGEYALSQAVIRVPSSDVTEVPEPPNDQVPPPTIPDGNVDNDSEITIGPFTATYYNGDTFVASEQVGRPSINYSYSNFYGIPSSSFHAIWAGNVEVFNETKVIDINFDVSWSDVSLTIDGVEVAAWANSDRTVYYQFSPGVHQVKVEYYNHWHTAGFNVSFTNNTMYSKDEASSLIAPYIDPDTQIIYVGAYESGDLYNNTTVTLDDTAGKVFLFLSSYDSLNWVVHNPNAVTIAGVAYSSHSGASTVTLDAAVPTIEIEGLAFGYSDFTGPSADITYLTGRAPDYSYGEYALSQATITAP